MNWTEEQGKAALAKISSLKRALGIANHPTKTDTFEFATHRFHIYTDSQESADLVAELLYRYGGGNRAAFYDAHPEKLTVRDTIDVVPLEGGGCDVSINIPSATGLTKALEKVIQKHIAPDKTFTR